MEMRWYACYTRARHEKKVHRFLEAQGIESLLPLVSRVRQWKDRKKAISFVLFPGYIFVRLSLPDFPRVLSTPGVVTLLANNGQPVAIPDADIENVRNLVQALALSDHEPKLVYFPEVGHTVQIASGPLRGIRGIVLGHRSKGRILVGVAAIEQGIEVNVDARALEPVST